MSRPEELVLEPGRIFSLAHSGQLVPFESKVIDALIGEKRSQHVNATYISNMPNIREAVRPAPFNKRPVNGTIADNTLQVMEEPYDQMANGEVRGLKYSRGLRMSQVSPEAERELRQHMLGFVLSALATSTRGGVLGGFTCELYYYVDPGGHFKRRTQLLPEINENIKENGQLKLQHTPVPAGAYVLRQQVSLPAGLESAPSDRHSQE